MAADPDLNAVEATPAGVFTSESRRHAIQSAITLLGTYFAGGHRYRLDSGTPGVRAEGGGDGEDRSEAFLQGLRLRVALASASCLAEIAEDILLRPNFRYAVHTGEAVGTMTGQLDVTRWATMRGRTRAPLVFPVRRVERSPTTPENVLATYALSWMVGELDNALVAADPPPGTDRRLADQLLRQLRRLLDARPYVGCTAQARRVAYAGTIYDVADRVNLRAEAGHVANPEPYQRLAGWMRRCLEGGPSTMPGDLDWKFYDSSFDPTLFELWCLHQIATATGDALGLATTVPDMRYNHRTACYAWDSLSGRIELHYQSSLTEFIPAVWAREPKAKPLGGRPDITVNGIAANAETNVAYIDPKLRRDWKSTDEIYKMLGYFGNTGYHDRGLGAVVFYTPGCSPQPINRYRTPNGGQVLAVGLDPARPDRNSAGLAELAQLVIASIGIEVSLPRARDGIQPTARETMLSAELVEFARRLGQEGLRPWLNQARLDIGDRFDALSQDHQVFVATALASGNALSTDADFSGPVIGLAKALEGLLRTAVLAPATVIEPSVGNQRMLGQIIGLLRAASAGQMSRPPERAVHRALSEQGIDMVALSALVGPLDQLNEFRRAAAHPTLVTRRRWVDCHALVLGPQALLVSSITVLIP